MFPTSTLLRMQSSPKRRRVREICIARSWLSVHCCFTRKSHNWPGEEKRPPNVRCASEASCSCISHFLQLKHGVIVWLHISLGLCWEGLTEYYTSLVECQHSGNCAKRMLILSIYCCTAMQSLWRFPNKTQWENLYRWTWWAVLISIHG